MPIILHIIWCWWFLDECKYTLVRPGKGALREIVGASGLVGALGVASGPHRILLGQQGLQVQLLIWIEGVERGCVPSLALDRWLWILNSFSQRTSHQISGRKWDHRAVCSHLMLYRKKTQLGNWWSTGEVVILTLIHICVGCIFGDYWGTDFVVIRLWVDFLDAHFNSLTWLTQKIYFIKYFQKEKGLLSYFSVYFVI